MVIVIRVALVCALALAAAGLAGSSLALDHRAQSGCTLVANVDPPGPPLESCHKGWFQSYPDLQPKGCTSVGVLGANELWTCPAIVEAERG